MTKSSYLCKLNAGHHHLTKNTKQFATAEGKEIRLTTKAN